MSEALEESSSYKKVVLGPSQVAIPDHWRVRKLGEIAEIVSGNTPKKSNHDYWGGDIVWVTPTDVTALDGKYISESEEHITEAGLANSSASLIEPGAVLMTSRATIGEVVINQVPVTTNQGFKTLVPNENVDCEYLYYYIPSIKQYLNAIGGGSTFSEISKKDVSSIKIPVPPLSEQRRIADILSTIDEQIQQTDRIVQTTKKLKEDLFNDLISTGVEQDAATKSVKVGPLQVEIPERWSIKQLKNVVLNEDGAIRTGPFGSKLKNEHHVSEGIKLYEQRHVYQEDFSIGNRHVTDEWYHSELTSYEARPFDVLITLQGTVGEAAMIPENAEKGVINPKLIRIRPDDSVVDPQYLARFLDDARISNQQIEFLSHGAVVSGLNVQTVGQIKVPLPPLSEQRRMIKAVNKVERKISEEENKKGLLKDLKHGLMQDLLTGNVRVDDD